MQTYVFIPNHKFLPVLKETKEMVLFEPFLLVNPSTESDDFPANDEPYYTSLEMQLRHLIYKFQKGWIQSERQVILSSDECIASVHFTFNEKKEVIGINVFQRSSNVLNLDEDIQFFNYFIKKYCSLTTNLYVTVSQPHIFKGKTKKVSD
ncbi:hypothetical protein [Priestia megaterium]|uniref:hypothetical protein n=1 Tax=Priestia megaterium TaxID=1404 RepID=UPI000BECB4C8|nr:hypothetical protein [Priestia megaterium]PED64027.1 hypothetical protein CON20_23990 [Priestia megaterium]